MSLLSRFVLPFLLTASLVAGEAVRAHDSCPVVDLRNEVLGEVPSQEDQGLCYAFVAADLVSHRIGRRVSAIGIALTNIRERDWSERLNSLFREDKFGSGHVRSSLLRSRATGFCPDEDLPATPRALAELRTIRGLEGKALTPIDPDGPFAPPPGLKSGLFLNLHMRTLNEILAGATTINHALFEAQKKNCERRVILPAGLRPIRRLRSDSPGDTEGLVPQIDERLDKGDIVGIDYEVFFDKRRLPDLHASTIVARRPLDGRCHYLIRNSWGKNSCHIVLPEYERKCEDGQVWVPADELGRHVRSINYLH